MSPQMENTLARVERTERMMEKLTQQVWELSNAVVLLSDTARRHGEYDERIRLIESEIHSNRSIMKALIWVATVISGTALAMIASYLFKGTQ